MRSFLFAISYLVTTILFAQQSITGRVVDAETREGLMGAHIYLLKDWRRGTTSGLEGKFEIAISNEDLGAFPGHK